MTYRRRRPAILLAFALAAAGACARPEPAPAARVAPSHTATAFQVDSALLAMSRRALWPGFDPSQWPLSIFDGLNSYLFRHPHPPAEYRSLVSPAGAVRSGREPLNTANSTAMIGGVTTATMNINGNGIARADALASLAVHELFHAFQRSRHPSWSANEADLFTYPVERADILALRRQETDALRRALAARRDDSSRCWARSFLDARRERFALLGADGAAYERGTELNEGLARYVELRALEMPVDLPAGEYPAEDVRQRAYETGAGLGQLLDRMKPDWRDVLEGAPATAALTLDGLLATAVERDGSAARCEVPGREAISLQATSDVQALGERRTRTRADFLAQPGWRIVLEPGTEPLFPQGFDPLNVRRMTATEVLHSRYLKLGNGTGAIELFSASLTEGRAGAHPLFGGVARLTVTGLAVAPAVRDSSGVLTIDARGIHGRLRGARADTSGQAIRVRLH